MVLRSSPPLVGLLLPSAAEMGGAWPGAALFPSGEPLPATASTRLGAGGLGSPVSSDLTPRGGDGPAVFTGAIPGHVSALRLPAPAGLLRRKPSREDKMAASAATAGPPPLELDSAAWPPGTFPFAFGSLLFSGLPPGDDAGTTSASLPPCDGAGAGSASFPFPFRFPFSFPFTRGLPPPLGPLSGAPSGPFSPRPPPIAASLSPAAPSPGAIGREVGAGCDTATHWGPPRRLSLAPPEASNETPRPFVSAFNAASRLAVAAAAAFSASRLDAAAFSASRLTAAAFSASRLAAAAFSASRLAAPSFSAFRLAAASFSAFLIILTLRTLHSAAAASRRATAATSSTAATAAVAGVHSAEQQQQRGCASLPAPVAEALVHYATSGETPRHQTEAEAGAAARVLARRAPCGLLVFGLGPDAALWAALNHGGRTLFLERDAGRIAAARAAHPAGLNLQAHPVVYNRQDAAATISDDLLALRNTSDCAAAASRPLSPEHLERSPCALAPRGLPAAFYGAEWDVIVVGAPEPGAVYAAGVAARARRPGTGETDVLVHGVDGAAEESFTRAFLCEGYLKEEAGRLRHFAIPSHRDKESMPFCP